MIKIQTRLSKAPVLPRSAFNMLLVSTSRMMVVLVVVLRQATGNGTSNSAQEAMAGFVATIPARGTTTERTH